MVFTPCMTGTEALYRPVEASEGDEREVLAVPVEAWDETGVPFVAGRHVLIDAAAFQAGNWVFVRLSSAMTWSGRPAEPVKRAPVTPADRDGVLERPARGAPPAPRGGP